jgi:hypothetical protein
MECVRTQAMGLRYSRQHELFQVFSKNQRPQGDPAAVVFTENCLLTTDNFLRCRLRLLGGTRCRVLPLELIDAASRVDQLLLASKERMAGRADFHADIALVRRAGLEGVPAGAGDINFVVSGVNTDLHFLTGIPFEISIVPKTQTPVTGSPQSRGLVAFGIKA